MEADPERIIALAERGADEAANVHPNPQLERLEERLRQLGLHTVLRLPERAM
ncbi:MAG: hypothetical protein IT384_09785 [Deltaproteobacteria bacterium]|nr:hypothetical protein [Deltaproteobacteria bacterium]